MSEKILPAEGKTFVAVYGSLRTGMSNYGVNLRAGAELVGKGRTVEDYDLHRYAGCYFPSVSLTHSDSEKPVVVEVFETTQAGLTGPYDGLEGYPNFYNRTVVPVVLDDGREVDAWIYHIDEKQTDVVDSGDWVEYLENLGEA